MPRRATCHDDDAPCSYQFLTIVDDCGEGNAVGIHIDASTNAVTDAIGLFEDFLQHEEGVTAFFQLSQCDVNLFHLRVLFFIVHVHHLQLLSQLQYCNVAIIQINHLIGVFCYWAGIGGQEEITVGTQAHDERRTLTGADDGVRVLAVEDGNGVGANHLMQSYLYGFEQLEVVTHHDVFDELHQYLGVCDALELYATRHQIFLDGGIVLNDAIVNKCQTPRR